MLPVPYVIKAHVPDVRASTFVFTAMKTMYGGKHIFPGDTVFVFASENEGGQGLIARGRVTAAEAVPPKRGVARQTPRVRVTVRIHPARVQARERLHGSGTLARWMAGSARP